MPKPKKVSASDPRTRLLSVFTRTLLSACSASPAQVRNLILRLDLIAAEFGLPFNDRLEVDVPDDDLSAEIEATASKLGATPVELHDELTLELERALAFHAPVECVAHIAARRLWETDPAAWSALMAILLRSITRSDSCEAITAVVAHRLCESSSLG